VVSLNGGRDRVALGANFVALNFPPPNCVAEKLPRPFHDCSTMPCSQSQSKIMVLRVGLSRFLTAIFPKFGIGSGPDPAPIPLRSVSALSIFYPPSGNILDRLLSMFGVIRFSPCFGFFGIGVWHGLNISDLPLSVKHGWTP